MNAEIIATSSVELWTSTTALKGDLSPVAMRIDPASSRKVYTYEIPSGQDVRHQLARIYHEVEDKDDSYMLKFTATLDLKKSSSIPRYCDYMRVDPKVVGPKTALKAGMGGQYTIYLDEFGKGKTLSSTPMDPCIPSDAFPVIYSLYNEPALINPVLEHGCTTVDVEMFLLSCEVRESLHDKFVKTSAFFAFDSDTLGSKNGGKGYCSRRVMKSLL